MTMVYGEKTGKRIFSSLKPILLSVVISGLIFMLATTVHAETRKWKINNHITKMQAIPIPDSPGRAIGFFERQGEVQFEDGETAKQLLRCTFDMIRGIGPFQGYAQIKFKDGSAYLVRIKGEMLKPKTGKLPISKGTGKYILGTGRFKGIKGDLVFKAKVLKPYGGESKGDALVEATGTFTLPGK